MLAEAPAPPPEIAGFYCDLSTCNSGDSQHTHTHTDSDGVVNSTPTRHAGELGFDSRVGHDTLKQGVFTVASPYLGSKIKYLDDLAGLLVMCLMTYYGVMLSSQ